MLTNDITGMMPKNSTMKPMKIEPIASGSFSSAPVYSGTPTLVYAAGRSVGNEWTAGTAVGSGVPRNVTGRAGR